MMIMMMMTRYRLRRRRKEESYLRNTKSRFIKTFSSVEEPSVRPHGLFFTWWGCYSVCYVTSGNTQSQSSQFSESLWTDSGLKSGISVRELISTKKKKKKKAQAGNESSNILPKSSHARKKPPPNQPSLPTPFYSVLVSVSVFVALSTVFLQTTLRFITLFFRSYLSLIGPFSCISLYESFLQPCPSGRLAQNTN